MFFYNYFSGNITPTLLFPMEVVVLLYVFINIYYLLSI